MGTVCRPPALIAAAVVLAVVWEVSARSEAVRSDPFEFLKPTVIVTAAERQRLDRNQVLARMLPGSNGQLAVFVATRLDAAPDALVAWTRAIAELKRSKYVLAIGRFSEPPKLSDLDALTLEPSEVDAIRRCRLGSCGLKLSAADIESFSRIAATGAAATPEVINGEFRRLLLERVRAYRAAGLGAMPAPADRRTPRRPDAVLSSIVASSPYLARVPDIAMWLQRYPNTASRPESFFYWSKEHYGEGKPIVSITHVGIVHSRSAPQLPAVIVVGKQIFATHYLEGSLGLTMVLRDETNGVPYLAYLNRSQLDMLRGFVGTLLRGVLEGRVERQAPSIIRGLRERLESGEPPDASLVPFSGWMDGVR